jgi:hypothetical protein
MDMVNMENSTRKIVEDFGRSWFWKCTSEIGCLFSLFLILRISASMPVFEPWSNRLTGLLTVNLSRSRPGQLRRGNSCSIASHWKAWWGDVWRRYKEAHVDIIYICIYTYLISIHEKRHAVTVVWTSIGLYAPNIQQTYPQMSLTDSTQAPLVTGSCGTCSQECSRKRKYRSYAGDGQHPRTWFTSCGLHF